MSTNAENNEAKGVVNEDGVLKYGDLEVLTVEEVIDRGGFGCSQLFVIAFGGLVWTVEAFEILLLAMLSAVLKCEWGLTPVQEATITAMVFVGFFIGAPFFGYIADKYGRKNNLFLVCLISSCSGLMSAFSPNFGWMVFLRMILGFAAAGSGQCITYCIEFLPVKTRGPVVLLTEMFWIFGGIGIVLIGMYVNTNPALGWRYMLIFAAIPVILLTFVIPIALPSSPKFLVLQGEKEQALKILNWMFKLNCKAPVNVYLVNNEEKDKLLSESDVITQSDTEGSPPPPSPNEQLIVVEKEKWYKKYMISYLFINGMWKTTLLLWIIWLMFVSYYYGIILLTTTIFQYDRHCSLESGLPRLDICKELTRDDYIALLWTTAAETPGIIITALILPFIGRKWVMASEMVVVTIFTGLLLVCTLKPVLTFFLVVCRALIAGAFLAVFVYTPEVYPTKIRALGLATSSSLGRIGGMVSPYIAQVIFPLSEIAGIVLFIVMALVSVVAILLLPIETKGRALTDTGEAKNK